MNSATQNLTLEGEVGVIEALLDVPAGLQARGTAVIAHPHPLFGGTMHNKVVQTLARAFVQCGWQAVRFNFRGVGASAGQYDEGRGEALDMVRVIAQTAASGPLALAGFFFWGICHQPCGEHAGHGASARKTGVGGDGRIAFRCGTCPTGTSRTNLGASRRARRYGFIAKRHGLGQASILAHHGDSRCVAFLSRTIAAAQNLGRRACASLSS